MPEKLKIVAQYAMDEYLGSYADSTSFFTINDFIFHVGASLSAIYLAEYKQQYLELRQEKTESVVTFAADWLLEQEIEMKRVEDEWVGTLKERPMSFPFDKQVVGIQSVTSRGKELTRSNATETWMYKYLPVSDEIYYRAQTDKIRAFTNGDCNLNKVKVLYVPSINNPESDVPDGVIRQAIDYTVGTMKKMQEGVVVKQTADSNSNQILQTEINSEQLR
jgi:hypothetical protein